MTLTKKLTAICALVVFMSPWLGAEVPRVITYQGRLTDAGGSPYNGSQNVTFRIYDGSGLGIWTSGTMSITFANGLFTVELGKSPQPPLPIVNWQQDTALTLGITISPDPELTPRRHFTTTGYAFTAKTADLASSIIDNSVTSSKIVNGSILYQDIGNNGATEGKVIKWQGGQWSSGTDEVGPSSGWTDAGSVIYNTTTSDSVGVGTTTPRAKLEVVAPVNQKAAKFANTSDDYEIPAIEVINPGQNTAFFNNGSVASTPVWPPCAIFGNVGGKAQGHAGWFDVYCKSYGALYTVNDADSGYGLEALAGLGTGAWLGGETGLECVGYGAYGSRFESRAYDLWSQVIEAKYTGSNVSDHVAVSGYSKPADYFGIGATFQGGYQGVNSSVYPTGSATYYGVISIVAGGSGVNYGLYSNVAGSLKNYGIYATASSGSTNWAGYFEGDVNVTGNIVKSSGGTKIDHPLDPANKYLQHSSVESDEMKNIYDGVVTLDASGKATVQLPEWFQALNGDFRYQLTCIGGYAPVYVESKISDNQFTIAGGKLGLEVSWQVTGVRQDKYAQAHPFRAEEEKGADVKGRYLHPELYGFGKEQSVSFDPVRTPQEQAKLEAIRANSAKSAADRIVGPAKSEKVTVK